MSFVQVDGANIWYQLQGEGDPLTTIGGDIMASDQFHFVYGQLVRNFQVVSWDFRGIGKSDRPAEQEYSIDRKVEDLKAVLDAAGIEKTHLWSVATGTFTAVVFAARYPERVASCIHYGQCRPSEGAKKIFDVLQLIHDSFDWPTTCDHMVHLYAPKPEFMDWTTQVYVRNADHSWMKQYRAELEADITDELRRTTCPMLVMIGDAGPLGAGTSYGSGWEVARECRPDTELAVVEGGTGTYYLVDAADRAAATAIQFFRKHAIGG